MRITNFLKNFDLQLIRKINRISIVGTEKNIRKAVNSLFSAKLLWEEDFSSQKPMISSYDINFITSLLETIEQRLKSGIAYPYNMNIFSHLYILMTRVREGELCSEPFFEEPEQEEKEIISRYQKVYQVAIATIDKIEGYLARTLPKSEVFYLFQYLISSRTENAATEITEQSEKAQKVTEYFSKAMGELMGVKIDDPVNKKDLLNHIQPLLYRLKNEIIIKNELLGDIKLEYLKTFQQVSQVSESAQQQFQLNVISEDEIGFLTLYFAKYKEMLRTKKRVLIMCSSGVGTSELLKVKIRKAFPELEIVAVLSAKKFQKEPEKYQVIDLIITTVHLTGKIRLPTILVNAVFTKQDEKRIKEMLGEM